MIILDNSVLSAFKRINALNLIRELSSDLIEEARSIKLGVGEAQAIVLAKHKTYLLALDDRRAKEEATERGVDITGSTGILRIAYEYCPIKTKRELRKLLPELRKDLYLEDWLMRWVIAAEKP